MQKGSKTYQRKHYISSVFLLLALAWLTVSTPFVFAAQQLANSSATHSSQDLTNTDEEQACTPLGNTTEEKASSSINSLSEEYLHHDDELFHTAEIFRSHAACHAVSEYVAFHGELLCPPPNSIL